ncbi:MAG: DUF2240 family protein [Euryarchaeota archaeon]|nr:DUF2240 family protein [Euryarchaeota archaeon]MDE1836007.1 DUF2240 family protein [Euryarchaeota archaeon]MDE1881602.1 DUF2240 family protein [Euryarchaeota archaeon]MDE2046001.1 DUF2240 family protein [Thermoplasmata archaeon]
MDDLRLVVTRLWDLLGRRPVSSKELVEALYARLHWFRPSEAEELVAEMQRQGLFQHGPSEGMLVASSEIEGIVVPITYRPPPNLRPSAAAVARPDLLARILETTAARSEVGMEALREETQKLAGELGVWPEAAALLVARRHGLDLPELREELDRRLREG